MTPEISKALAELANKLGTSVEHLWPLMVKHEVATSVTALVAGSIFSIGLFFLAYKLYRYTSDDGDGVFDFPVIMAACLGLMLAVFSLAEIPDIIVPEAAAIKSLLAK